MSDVEKQIEQWQEGLAGSELLGHSDVRELESHLREEMERLKTTDISADEAFLLARHRLGDTAALEEEFAKVNPHRRVANRLYWMVLGVLGYYVLVPLLHHLAMAFGCLAYRIGLRGTFLTCFTWTTGMIVFAGMTYLLLQYLASHWDSHIMAKRIVVPIGVTVLAAGVNLLLYWSLDIANHHLWSRILPSREDLLAVTLRQPVASMAWYLGVVCLFGGALALFARRSRERAEVR